MLVAHAFHSVPLYRTKYVAVGFDPRDLKTWSDFSSLPPLTKSELIEAWPDTCISQDYNVEFMTTSSGSSGRFVYLAVDEAAVQVDTLQGARQLDFQSAGTVTPQHLTLNITTCPWWFSSIDGTYPVQFMSTRTPVDVAVREITGLRPTVLCAYPSYLKELAVPLSQGLASCALGLVITHSEASTKQERDDISRVLKVPVLDEYSSEELTRIALECPARTYHLEEDACYVEILDPEGVGALPPGLIGEVVGTNLLNMATPLIRYRQGDLATLTDAIACPCGCTFRHMQAPLGRIQDSFLTPDGRRIPAGTLMDEAYNWVLEARIPVNGLQYQIVQQHVDQVCVFLAPYRSMDAELQQQMSQTVRSRMERLVGDQIRVEVVIVDELLYAGPKHKAVISTVPAMT